MGDIVVRAENLGKSYQITHNSRRGYKTLQEDMLRLLKSPFGKRSDTITRETFWALQDVSFDVKYGEVLGIIGRNGAGKSTLLKILSRITKPTVGRADIYGRIGSLLEVGTGFHPELTGRENIFLNGAILGMARRDIQKHFDEIVAFAEVEQFLDTPVKRYSSGMYMRLAFAVAAHLEPEVLVIDEVLAVGDAEFQKKCLGKMSDIAQSGRTVLFVSHNMNAIEELCTRVLLLNKGTVNQLSSDVRSVITHYLKSDDVNATKWVNSGNEFPNPYFQPLSFKIVDRNGMDMPMPLRNDDDFYVQLEGKVEQLDPALTIGCAVYSETGELLFWSYQTDVAEENWPKLQTGLCVLRGKLPERLLNQGGYRIEFVASLHFREWILQPGLNAPSIQIEINGGLSESPYWMVKRPGLIAPVIEWKLESQAQVLDPIEYINGKQ